MAVDLSVALKRWTAVVGQDRVFADEATLDRYAASTLPRAPRPLAVLRPRNREEVVGCVAAARRSGIPLYPISRGKNWGYGDACPVREGQVVLDLSGMDRILEVDQTLAYAVIEPGVTQGQLAERLEALGGALWLDSTGAGPDTSIAGNILDRGFGHTPYGNRPQFVCGLEVVTGTGEVLRTGLGHYPAARAAATFPYGIGPSLDGLFLQSNFGIVTRLCVWLMPRPEAYALFVCSLPRDEDLPRAVDTLRGLKLDGTLRSVVHVGNDLRLISSGRTAASLGAEGGALSTAQREALRRAAGIGAWTFAGGLYGDPGQVGAALRRLRRSFRPHGWQMNVVTSRRLDLADRVLPLAGRFRFGRQALGKLRAVRGLFNLNRGMPSRQFLAGAYWKRRQGLPEDFPARADPALDNCGMLWLSPVMPMTGEQARELLALVEPLFAEHGFDFFVTFSTVNERTLAAVMTIAFDKENEDERRRAEACYESCFGALMRAGFIPYRVGIQSMADLAGGSQGYWPLVAKLRTALDPDGVVAPGRYQPDLPAPEA
ncbi:MAG: FAD-binding oxidoreductase [Tistlia sp.]|uniref:FAD-binding oxidoreductase n=1 Tax=Tistlia sp. TaxID=3057121 RepID=UPI0034A25549